MIGLIIMNLSRRSFLQHSALAAAALAASGCASVGGRRPLFQISLAEWSLNRALFGGKLEHLDFPETARQEFGIDGIELVNQFMMKKAKDQAYLAEFKRRADGEGVKVLLIMCDGEGALGDPDATKRLQAVMNHHQWADAAKFFGCHSIRVNADAKGQGSFEEQQKRAADGLRSLSEYCGKLGLNCIVENHGGLSSNGAWLSGVMRLVGRPNCGTLPDFGNFTTYDRYQGVTEMMPFAKAVSAKTNAFDAAGNCVETDYRRMLKIVLAAGYRGYFGIEYEGGKLPEPEGIRATKALLEKIREEMS